MKKSTSCYGWLALALLCVVTFVVEAAVESKVEDRGKSSTTASMPTSTLPGAASAANIAVADVSKTPSSQQSSHKRTPRRSPRQQDPSSDLGGKAGTWMGPLRLQVWDSIGDAINDSPVARADGEINYIQDQEYDEQQIANSRNSEENELAARLAAADDEQLNWRDSQLARLHGLGPAEIAALSSWQEQQRRSRLLHSQPKRLVPAPAVESALPRAASSSSNRFQASPSSTTTNSVDATTNKSRVDEEANALPWSPPATSKRNGKSEPTRESSNKINSRNGVNRKEKAENSSSPGKSGKSKGSRKQQQQPQEPAAMPQHPGRITDTGSGSLDGTAYGRASGVAMPVGDNVSRINRNLAAQFLLRSPRENRQYDVPIIGKSIKCKLINFL